MSRRSKLLITALFLVLLGIPAVYIALTWHAVDPFRFRYVGRGEVVMRSVDPFGGGPEYPVVPISIEVQNISKHPAYLQSGYLIEAGQGRGAVLEDMDLCHIMGTIPQHGTVRLEYMVDPEEAQRIERGTFEVSYEAVSATKREISDFVYQTKRTAAWLFDLDVDYPVLKGNRFVGVLTKSQSQSQSHLPSPASEPAATSQHHESPTDSPEGLPPPAPRVDTHPR
jgi:hypothetical protein